MHCMSWKAVGKILADVKVRLICLVQYNAVYPLQLQEPIDGPDTCYLLLSLLELSNLIVV